tara:strand:+ start:1531 stop:1950 length:420 start_codon:yes stop_codon:yes gene_type:complete
MSEIISRQNDEYLRALRLDIEAEIKDIEISEEKTEILRNDIEKKLIELESFEDDVIESQKYHYSPQSLRNKRLLFFEKGVSTLKPNNDERSDIPTKITSNLESIKIVKLTCNCLTKKGTICKLIARRNGRCHIHLRTDH